MNNILDITLMASEVSFFSGHNHYATENSRINSLLKYNKWLNQYLNKSKEKDFTDIVNDLDKGLTSQIFNKVSDFTDDFTIEEKKDYIKEYINSIITNASKTDTEDESKKLIPNLISDELNVSVEKEVSKNRGKERENISLSKYGNSINKPVVNNGKRFFKKLLTFGYKNKTININIYGKIDGMVDDFLVESKNRRSQIFCPLPLYELVQVEMYFHVTGLKKCKFIQNYNKVQEITEYEHSDIFLNEIKENLIIFFFNLLEKMKLE